MKSRIVKILLEGLGLIVPRLHTEASRVDRNSSIRCIVNSPFVQSNKCVNVWDYI